MLPRLSEEAARQRLSLSRGRHHPASAAGRRHDHDVLGPPGPAPEGLSAINGCRGSLVTHETEQRAGGIAHRYPDLPARALPVRPSVEDHLLVPRMPANTCSALSTIPPATCLPSNTIALRGPGRPNGSSIKPKSWAFCTAANSKPCSDGMKTHHRISRAKTGSTSSSVNRAACSARTPMVVSSCMTAIQTRSRKENNLRDPWPRAGLTGRRSCLLSQPTSELRGTPVISSASLSEKRSSLFILLK